MFAYFTFSFSSYLYFRSYNNQLTRIISSACDLHLALSSITLYLTRINLLEFSTVLAFILFIPISLQISYILEKTFTKISLKTTSTQGINSNTNPKNLVHFTTKILKGFDFSYIDYAHNPNSVILEEIISNHI